MRDPDTVELENIAADLPTSALADAIAGRKKFSTRRMLRCEPHNVKWDTVFDLLPERFILAASADDDRRRSDPAEDQAHGFAGRAHRDG